MASTLDDTWLYRDAVRWRGASSCPQTLRLRSKHALGHSFV